MRAAATLSDVRVVRSTGMLGALALALVATLLACAAVGSVSTPVAGIASMLMDRLGVKTGASWSAQQTSVLFAIRLPRVVLGSIVGGALGVSGATMQGVFRNPLVDPGLLGVSSGAALAAVASIVLGDHVRVIPAALVPYTLPLAAFGGGMLAMIAVERLGRREGRTVVATLLLAGIAVNALAGALTGLLTYVATDAQLRTLTFWSLGSLGGATWQAVFAAGPFVAVPIVLLPLLARPLNAMLLGEADAGFLGIDVERTKRVALVLVALAVGASVAVSGVLGFVGLVVPHLVRLAAGPDHRIVLPGSALLGAILLLLADALARTIVTPAELPLGVVTACVGAPFFLALLLRARREVGA